MVDIAGEMLCLAWTMLSGRETEVTQRSPGTWAAAKSTQSLGLEALKWSSGFTAVILANGGCCLPNRGPTQWPAMDHQGPLPAWPPLSLSSLASTLSGGSSPHVVPTSQVTSGALFSPMSFPGSCRWMGGGEAER